MIGNLGTGRNSRKYYSDYKKEYLKQLEKKIRLELKCFRSSNNGIKGIEKRILELDIEKCFDRISHKAILEKVIAPEFIINGLRKCLKTGTNPEFPNQGTPQGGVVSPLLANIALNGIEKIGETKLKNGKFKSTPSMDNFKNFRSKIKHIVNNSNYGAPNKSE